MGGVTDSPSVFPLRLRDPRLRELVREVAEHEHISQNELIEQAVSNEVVARGALIAADLATAATRLAKLSTQRREQAVAASIERFAEGEGLGEPLSSRASRVASVGRKQPGRAHQDPLGVIAAFDAGRR